MKYLPAGAIFSLTLSLCLPAAAHHSSAAYDTATEIKLEGTVTSYNWRNPHVFIKINVEQADGSVVEREIEAGSSSVLIPLGVNKNSVAVGDRVTVTGNPQRRNSDKGMILGKELVKADGTYLPLFIASRSARSNQSATAKSIAGTWFSPVTEFFQFLGATRSWPLNEKGAAARDAGSNMEAVQANCIPIAAPALMVYPVTQSIIVEEEQVILKVDWMGTERIVHLDGRGHPPADQTFLHGHSVGHWEGDTLVVDTTNFSEHAAGLSTSLPSSEQKRMEERFAVSQDGKKLIYSGTVEDPEYLTERVGWSTQLDYSPDLEHSNEECDLEIARRFLIQDRE